METSIPNLDDRSFSDLVEQALSLIPHYCPEWTDAGPSDPGRVLLELYAAMLEQVSYRLNRLPEKNHLTLLSLLGLQPLPAQAARTVLVFEGNPGAAPSVPAGTPVANSGAEPVVFETLEDLRVIPSKLKALVSSFGRRHRDHWERLKQGFGQLLFTEGDEFPRHLLINDSRLLALEQGIPLELQLLPAARSPSLAGLVRVEAFDGKEWKPLVALPGTTPHSLFLEAAHSVHRLRITAVDGEGAAECRLRELSIRLAPSLPESPVFRKSGRAGEQLSSRNESPQHIQPDLRGVSHRLNLRDHLRDQTPIPQTAPVSAPTASKRGSAAPAHVFVAKGSYLFPVEPGRPIHWLSSDPSDESALHLSHPELFRLTPARLLIEVVPHGVSTAGGEGPAAPGSAHSEGLFSSSEEPVPGSRSSDPHAATLGRPKAGLSSSQLPGPHFSEFSDPHFSDPQLSDPQLSDPHISDPHISDPQISDPQLSDLPDPYFSDPGPRLLDPRLSDLPDPHLSGPALHPSEQGLSDFPDPQDSELQDPHPDLQDPHSDLPEPRLLGGPASHFSDPSGPQPADLPDFRPDHPDPHPDLPELRLSGIPEPHLSDLPDPQLSNLSELRLSGRQDSDLRNSGPHTSSLQVSGSQKSGFGNSESGDSHLEGLKSVSSDFEKRTAARKRGSGEADQSRNASSRRSKVLEPGKLRSEAGFHSSELATQYQNKRTHAFERFESASESSRESPLLENEHLADPHNAQENGPSSLSITSDGSGSPPIPDRDDVPPLRIIWEFWSGSSWQELGRSTTERSPSTLKSHGPWRFQDGSRGLSQKGLVEFDLPEELASLELGGIKAPWIRLRPSPENLGSRPAPHSTDAQFAEPFHHLSLASIRIRLSSHFSPVEKLSWQHEGGEEQLDPRHLRSRNSKDRAQEQAKRRPITQGSGVSSAPTSQDLWREGPKHSSSSASSWRSLRQVTSFDDAEEVPASDNPERRPQPLLETSVHLGRMRSSGAETNLSPSSNPSAAFTTISPNPRKNLRITGADEPYPASPHSAAQWPPSVEEPESDPRSGTSRPSTADLDIEVMPKASSFAEGIAAFAPLVSEKALYFGFDTLPPGLRISLYLALDSSPVQQLSTQSSERKEFASKPLSGEPDAEFSENEHPFSSRFSLRDGQARRNFEHVSPNPEHDLSNPPRFSDFPENEGWERGVVFGKSRLRERVGSAGFAGSSPGFIRSEGKRPYSLSDRLQSHNPNSSNRSLRSDDPELFLAGPSSRWRIWSGEQAEPGDRADTSFLLTEPFSKVLDEEEASPELQFEVWLEDGWTPVAAEDRSAALCQSGILRLQLPAQPSVLREFFGRKAHWIRARLLEGGWRRPPLLKGIWLNSVEAEEGETRQFDFDSNGDPEQVLYLPPSPPLLSILRVESQQLPAVPRHHMGSTGTRERVAENALYSEIRSGNVVSGKAASDAHSPVHSKGHADGQKTQTTVDSGQLTPSSRSKSREHCDPPAFSRQEGTLFSPPRSTGPLGLGRHSQHKDSEGSAQDSGSPFSRRPARWIRWNQVEGLYRSGPHDLHFNASLSSGQIRFGDGKNGAIPPPGPRSLRVTARQGGGERGNLAAGSLSLLLRPLRQIRSVYQPLPAVGGCEAESVPHLRRRAAWSLRSQNRAVTRQDFEVLAHEASAEVARAHCLARPDGRVQVVLIPGSPAHSGLYLPSSTLLSRVNECLEARRPLTLRFLCTAATFVFLDVDIELVLEPGADKEGVFSELRDSLFSWLHPLRGGPRCEGWPLGRAVTYSEVLSRVESVEGIAETGRLRLLLRGSKTRQGLSEYNSTTAAGHKLRLPADGLPHLLNLEVRSS